MNSSLTLLAVLFCISARAIFAKQDANQTFSQDVASLVQEGGQAKFHEGTKILTDAEFDTEFKKWQVDEIIAHGYRATQTNTYNFTDKIANGAVINSMIAYNRELISMHGNFNDVWVHSKMNLVDMKLMIPRYKMEHTYGAFRICVNTVLYAVQFASTQFWDVANAMPIMTRSFFREIAKLGWKYYAVTALRDLETVTLRGTIESTKQFFKAKRALQNAAEPWRLKESAKEQLQLARNHLMSASLEFNSSNRPYVALLDDFNSTVRTHCGDYLKKDSRLFEYIMLNKFGDIDLPHNCDQMYWDAKVDLWIFVKTVVKHIDELSKFVIIDSIGGAVMTGSLSAAVGALAVAIFALLNA